MKTTHEDDFAKLYRDDNGRQVLVYADCGDPAEMHIILHTGWALVDMKMSSENADRVQGWFEKVTRESALTSAAAIRAELGED